MSELLKGIKVLEIANWVAAPSACSILADLGAEVTKIEHPETGDPVRSIDVTPDGIITSESDDENTSFEQLNRGKKSVGINLGNTYGQEIVRKLVEDVDIVVTNLVPERQAKYHLTYEDCLTANPQIIYVALTGYGTKGEERDRLGFDYAAFWARSGIMGSIGNEGESPAQQRPGMGDQVTSLALTTSISLALLDKERTGKGKKIECSLLHSGLWVLGLDFAAAMRHKKAVKKHSPKHTNNPLSNFYRTKDLKWIQLVMFDSDRFWPGFCNALGIENLGAQFGSETAMDRAKNSTELIQELTEIFLSKSLAEWGAKLDEEGCIWAPVQTLDESIMDPQIKANDYTSTIENSYQTEIEIIKVPFKISGEDINPISGAPILGQHTEEKLLQAGYSWEQIGQFKEEGAII